MITKKTEQFLEKLSSSLEDNNFIKITISDKRNKNNDLKNVSVKQVSLKAGLKLSFVYRYPTKDITKNHEVNEAIVLIKELLEKDFLRADLFTSDKNHHLVINKKNRLVSVTEKPSTNTELKLLSHDKIKTRLIDPENNSYLFELGITTNEGKVKADKNDKFRQINKYLEILDGIIKSSSLPDNLTIADMGSGKGYLTFALYDFLVNQTKFNPVITGVEYKEELVEKCNSIAKKSRFENLSFKKGSIETADFPPADILIALHACDTATDEAICRGIKSDSKIIICAPCCHKQIRKELKPGNEIKEITKHGILEERLAEILTDSIRSLILEAYGYKTKVFEFISTEHTPKNILIVGIKENKEIKQNHSAIEQIKNLKSIFGIDSHYLEKLMEK